MNQIVYSSLSFLNDSTIAKAELIRTLEECSKLIGNKEDMVMQQMVQYIATKQQSSHLYVMIAVVCAVLIVLITPSLNIFHVLQNKRWNKYINTVADEVTNQKIIHASEKARADRLLEQLLPPTVSYQLKMKGFVRPETFDCITILQTDIVGFTSIVSQRTPLETVDLLNALFEMFDETLNQFDVFKVQTVGDAYVVASGIPLRNGDSHAEQICTTALHLLKNLEEFCVPHFANEKISVRSGVHSGPCAAGVVGVRMPRYCLFGHTITFVQIVEASGYGIKVTIPTNTYWLLGKQGFAFQIKVTEATEKPMYAKNMEKEDCTKLGSDSSDV